MLRRTHGRVLVAMFLPVACGGDASNQTSFDGGPGDGASFTDAAPTDAARCVSLACTAQQTC